MFSPEGTEAGTPSASVQRDTHVTIAPTQPDLSFSRRWRDAVAAVPEDDVTGDLIRHSAHEGMQTPSSPVPFLDQIQKSFGDHDIGNIEAHVAPAAAASAKAMNAAAYATGDHVVFGITPNLHLAAHEAAHVVQQRSGVQIAGGIGKPGDVYEQQADAVANRVATGQMADDLLPQIATGGGRGDEAPGSHAPSAPVHLSPVQMVRMLRSMGPEYVIFRGAGLSAAKKTSLLGALNSLGTSALGTRLEDEIESVVFDYYGKLVRDPSNASTVRSWAQELRTHATDGQPFDADRVIDRLEAIDKALVSWQAVLGFRSAAGKNYTIVRITEYPGLTKSFEDVRAGRATNAAGITYNAHGYRNDQSRLPLHVNFTTFDWITNDNNRGAKRGVYGSDGSLYVTDDHYGVFERVIATGTNPVITPPSPFRPS